MIESTQELSLLPADPPDADLVLAQLASAAVSDIAPPAPSAGNGH